jgi:hypothetical protein
MAEKAIQERQYAYANVIREIIGMIAVEC